MSYTIPSDAHAAGDAGHTIDHNNLADMAALLTAIGLQLYQRVPALPTGNTNNPANVTALAALLGSTTTALLSTQLGAANGAASLDATGLVPVSELPIATQSLFLAGPGAPASGLGLSGDTYEDTTAGKLYTKSGATWTGSTTLPGWGLLATTGPSGFTLQNATPTIFTWTAPNDGNWHRVMLVGEATVTATETGGAVNLTYFDPAAPTTLHTVNNVWGAALTAGDTGPSGQSRIIVAPNTVVSLVQGSAVTAGGPTVIIAELWGS